MDRQKLANNKRGSVSRELNIEWFIFSEAIKQEVGDEQQRPMV